MILMLGVLGLILGSFTNALVWRLHEQQKETKKQKAKNKKELSILHGRSMCTHCHHKLAWQDLVPLFSWLWLRGRCRYCHQKIDDNPLVEALLGLVFIISYIYWP